MYQTLTEVSAEIFLIFLESEAKPFKHKQSNTRLLTTAYGNLDIQASRKSEEKTHISIQSLATILYNASHQHGKHKSKDDPNHTKSSYSTSRTN